MTETKRAKVRYIYDRTRVRLRALAGTLQTADADDLEALRAAIDYERWLGDACEVALDERV